MVITGPIHARMRRLSLLFVGVMLAALAVSTLLAPPAAADEVNVDKYDYIFSGNVKFNGEPVEGVQHQRVRHGYDEDVKTDAEGKWKVGVPKKAEYKITLIEKTLPKGVIVDEAADPTGRVVVTDEGATIKAEFGLTNNKSVNFFLGEGVRESPASSTSSIERIDQRPQLRPACSRWPRSASR